MGPGGQLNDTHKKWGVAIFVLYFFQLSLGGFIHFIKVRFLCVLGRSVQNYFHALFGIFLIGISFYQVSCLSVPYTQSANGRVGAHGLPHRVAALHRTAHQ